MPDFERVLRDLEVDLSSNKDVARAYHRGLDRARKEIALYALILFIVTCALLFLIL